MRGDDGKVTYRQRGEDLEVSQKLLNIQVGACLGGGLGPGGLRREYVVVACSKCPCGAEESVLGR